MSDRSKLGLGVAVLVAFLAVLVWLRNGDATVDRAAAVDRADPDPIRPRPEPRAPRIDSAPQLDSEPAPVEPDAERRDHTGELLSDGPAREISLPERPEAAENNSPSVEQSESVMLDVISRLDREIAAAEASGDQAEAARLQVRRDRLERKLAERRAPEPPG